jgi:hypothetical protein
MANQNNQANGVNPVNPENKPYRRRHFSIFWPLLLIALGVFLFLNNVGVVPGSGWDVVVRLWPLLLIAGGLDGLFRREGLVWAVVLIGLGLAFLLSNLGYLSISAWEVIVRFWPVFLVAVGLDILIGHRRPWAPVIGAIVGLLLVGGIALLIFAAPGITNQRTEAINFALNDVTQAHGSIDMAVGRLDLTSGAGAAALMDGTVNLGASGTLRQSGPTSGNPASFSLGADNSSYVSFGVNDTDHWTLHLNPAVTYSLDVNMGVGDEIFNLTDLSVSSLNLNLAVGRSEVWLPVKGSVTGSIRGAVGEETIYVPRGAVVHLNLETGLTSVSIPSDYTRSDNVVSSPTQQTDGPTITLNVAQALGAVNVRYLP